LHSTITIRLLGQEYKVKTGGNEERILSLSHYVNQKVLDVQQKGSAISTMELIAMVMLDLADELDRAKSELRDYKESVSEKVDQLLTNIDTESR
jgi:cell division protein ZapA (FtsZ GTPase activity inhibitor)